MPKQFALLLLILAFIDLLPTNLNASTPETSVVGIKSAGGAEIRVWTPRDDSFAGSR